MSVDRNSMCANDVTKSLYNFTCAPYTNMIMCKISAFYHENKHKMFKIYVYDQYFKNKSWGQSYAEYEFIVCVFIHYITF